MANQHYDVPKGKKALVALKELCEQQKMVRTLKLGNFLHEIENHINSMERFNSVVVRKHQKTSAELNRRAQLAERKVVRLQDSNKALRNMIQADPREEMNYVRRLENQAATIARLSEDQNKVFAEAAAASDVPDWLKDRLQELVYEGLAVEEPYVSPLPFVHAPTIQTDRITAEDLGMPSQLSFAETKKSDTTPGTLGDVMRSAQQQEGGVQKAIQAILGRSFK